MTEKVIQMVKGYTSSKMVGEHEFDVFIVWHCYILGNMKWLVSTTIPDGMYYEVTYNNDKGEFYLDAYKKVENKRIYEEDVLE
jgi:hypothetical protein